MCITSFGFFFSFYFHNTTMHLSTNKSDNRQSSSTLKGHVCLSYSIACFFFFLLFTSFLILQCQQCTAQKGETKKNMYKCNIIKRRKEDRKFYVYIL